MPRARRIHIPGAFYHVTLRGNHREPIFRVPGDRVDLEEIVGDATLRHGVSIHAYCWMTNHIHLLAQADQVPVGRMIHMIAMRYARRFQRNVPTTGHLFERRYHARMVDTDAYLLEAVRYIHLNPVAAGIARSAAEYRWSSHCAYLGPPAPPWLTTTSVLAVFDQSASRARASYAIFIAAGEQDALVRSAVDTFSGDEFAWLQAPREAASAPVSNAALEALIAETCMSAGISVPAVASSSRARNLSRLRAEIASAAVRRGIATLREVAVRMGRHPSSLTRLLQNRR
jgi:REP element-mobilizing transposase RayT